MKGVILAAGRGRRLGELTEKKPKCFLKVDGMRLIDWQISALRSNGINDITVITGYKTELFEVESFKTVFNVNWRNSEILESLLCAEHLLHNDECIISYSDIIYKPAAIEALVSSRGEFNILYDINWKQLWSERFEDPLSDAETFVYDENNFLLHIGGKQRDYSQIMGQYMGIIKTKPSSWKKIKKYLERVDKVNREKLQITQFLNELIENRILQIDVVPCRSKWAEIDSEKDLKIAKKVFINRDV